MECHCNLTKETLSKGLKVKIGCVQNESERRRWVKTTNKEKVVDIAMDKMEQIRKAVGDFKDTVASHVKDLHAEVKDWRFGMESKEEGVIVDVSVKLLIKTKEKK